MSQVSILILDDDQASQLALRYILDSEGWKVRVVARASQALAELANGNWSLAIVNVAMSGLDGPLYSTLKELALTPVEGAQTCLRVLFLVPDSVAIQAQKALELAGLPYALKPFHLHDFLEKVSDLLLETHAISEPIRRLRHDPKGQKHWKEHRPSPGRRDTSMFAAREDYVMTEEEIAEFERKEAEEHKKKRRKQPQHQ